MTRQQAVNFLIEKPAKFGNLVGFDKLGDLQNKWIKEMLSGKTDITRQAHRESYKTTSVSVALCLYIILLPNIHTMFMRKTDGDVKEVITQVQKMLQSPYTQYFVQTIYGVNLKLLTQTNNEILTNLCTSASGTPQLLGMGIGSSLTGKHFDRIFTDDIVNIQDRISRSERERTKLIYQELQNIKNRGGRIINTGTPWHPEDAFSLMPNLEKVDCYTSGLMTEEDIEAKRKSMLPSLFAANYELRHIASEDVIFTNPNISGELEDVANADISHVDAAYGGGDSTALTIAKKKGNTIYIYGKKWHKHVDDCIPEIVGLHNELLSVKLYCEDNGDKGYLAKALKAEGVRAITYHENTNKFIKITSYLKGSWENVVFVKGTDKEYIQEVVDYNEHAENDDAPDSLASAVRILSKKREKQEYVPIW